MALLSMNKKNSRMCGGAEKTRQLIALVSVW